MKLLFWVLLFLVFSSAHIVFSNEKGRDLFTKNCASCHTIGGKRLIGPDLKGVSDRHSESWLLEFTKSSRVMIEKKDSEALKLLAEYGLVMPDVELPDDEIKTIFQYIKDEGERLHVEKKLKKSHVKEEHEKYAQPIHFSHRLHAGDYKIPCLYCHSGAQKSRHAGVPSANVCLNCHSQIKLESPEIQKIHAAVNQKRPLVWYKRHHFPDHAYFNHSWHIGAGIRCQTCHGEIETMEKPKPIQITMGWCVNCHRESDKTMGPLKNEPIKHHKNITKLDCARCHH